tara:strand:+ start:344 stop:514 length:171 start_codon:yes stop_codon:yes gene_type:complete
VRQREVVVFESNLMIDIDHVSSAKCKSKKSKKVRKKQKHQDALNIKEKTEAIYRIY